MTETNDGTIIEEILRKKPDLRTFEDIEGLYEWVTQNGSMNKIFNGVQEIICKTICREMTLLTVPAQYIVCRQGDFGDTFYIIISGSVSLLIKDQKPLNNNEDTNINNTNPLNVLANGNIIENKDYGKFIKRLRPGGTFGELAVIDPTARRSCTVQADKKTSFICLKRAAYQRLVRTNTTHHIDFSLFEFFQSIFLFDSWSQGDITRLSNKVRQVKIPAENYLVRHGSECQGFYLIYSGEIQESVPLMVFSEMDGTNCKYIPMDEMSNERQIQQYLPNKNLKRRRMNLELTLYGPYDICGEYPLMNGSYNQEVDLRAITDIRAFFIDKNIWNEMFAEDKTDYVVKTYNLIKQISYARESWRKTRINIAISNPGLLLTLSTRDMMECIGTFCGWCGKKEHITGDLICPKYIKSQQTKMEEKLRIEKRQLNIKQKQEQENTLHPTSLKSLLHNKKQLKKLINNNNSNNNDNYNNHRHNNSNINENIEKSSIAKFKFKAQILSYTVNLDQSKLPTCKEQLDRDWNILKLRNKFRSSKEELHLPTLPGTDKENIDDLEIKNENTILLKNKDLYKDDNINRNNEEKKNDENVECQTISISSYEMPISVYRKELLKELKKIKKIDEYHEKRNEIIKNIDLTEAGNIIKTDLKLFKKPKVPKNKKLRKPGRPKRLDRKVDRILKRIWPKDNQIQKLEENFKNLL